MSTFDLVCVCDCICEHLLISVCNFVCVNVTVGFWMNMCVCVCVCVWMCRRGDIVQSLKLKCWNKVLISWDHLCLPFRISASSTNDSEILRCQAIPYTSTRGRVYLRQKRLISGSLQILAEKCQGQLAQARLSCTWNSSSHTCWSQDSFYTLKNSWGPRSFFSFLYMCYIYQ